MADELNGQILPIRHTIPYKNYNFQNDGTYGTLVFCGLKHLFEGYKCAGGQSARQQAQGMLNCEYSRLMSGASLGGLKRPRNMRQLYSQVRTHLLCYSLIQFSYLFLSGH